MKMPGGGDWEGMTAAITVSRDVELARAGRYSCTTSMDAKPAKIGVTVAGGAWGRTMQQLALVPLHGMLMCMQQLCAAGCAGATHVPTDSSNTPIRVMATAVRRPTPCSMV